MYNTSTNTSTFTVADIKKAFEGFEAEIRMIARETGKWSMTHVDNLFHDVRKWAEEEYISVVDVALMKDKDTVVKARKYTINSNGTATSSARAGESNWPDTADTYLKTIINFKQNWLDLTEEQREKFKTENNFKLKWGPCSIDNSFPHLTKSKGQLFASKGYELQQESFE